MLFSMGSGGARGELLISLDSPTARVLWRDTECSKTE